MRLRTLLRDRLACRLGLPEIPVAMRRLLKQGFRPKTIVDVGAHRGEFARTAFAVWPAAKLLCVEPLPHAADVLRSLPQTHCGKLLVFQGLAGPRSLDSVALHAVETASSVLREYCASHPTIRCRMEMLDTIVELAGFPTPDFIKLDVQGYELEVLKGGEQTLRTAQVLLTEVNLLDLHVGVPLLHEVTGWLFERGFVCYDVCGLTRRPLDGALWQVDMLFVHVDSALRRDKRWAAGLV